MKPIASDQDFAALMAHGWAMLREHVANRRTSRTDYDQRFARELHTAMGYRKEHMNELEF
jgi:hypothetical protein